MTKRSTGLFGLTLACLAAACAVMMMTSCGTSSPVARHLAADQNGVTEAGRSMELAELTVQLSKHYRSQDPERWTPLVHHAADLSQNAGRLLLGRARAVSGSRADAEQFYTQIDSHITALRAQREQLAADLSAALPGT